MEGWYVLKKAALLTCFATAWIAERLILTPLLYFHKLSTEIIWILSNKVKFWGMR